ncbi:MAG: membrane protein insertion efficiency factor YidD [Puniceicoccales bacterium]|nr:membrane protein insertion efficiency factor YidD [Puniceicoccales bacterium]
MFGSHPRTIPAIDSVKTVEKGKVNEIKNGRTGMAVIPMFLFRLFLEIYAWVLSPILTLLSGTLHRCRFTPPCSQYARQSLAVYGPRKAFWLTLKRLAKCHPWQAGGYDPIP